MVEAADALRREIHEAFAHRPYPGDGSLALRHPGCTDYDGEAVFRFFRGKDWRSLTLDSLANDPDLDPNSFMSFMQAEGFVYFLPAFLLLSLELEHPRSPGEILAFKLTDPGAGAPAEWATHFARIVALLSPAERRAVVHTLEYLAEAFKAHGYPTNQARLALDGFWGAVPVE